MNAHYNQRKKHNLRSNLLNDNLGHTTLAPLKVMIVDDDKKVRDMYAEILCGTNGLTCVGSYGDCESALAALETLVPDVILMDIGLPGMSGIEGVQQVKALYPHIEIIMLTIYDDDDKIFRSICAGASGYMLKNSNPDELVSGIRNIQTGAAMSASIARRVLNFVRQYPPVSSEDYGLTRREMDILQLMVEGHSDKVIADLLFISPYTVNSHIKRIYEKLHVHSKSQAVSTALKNRLV